MYHNVMLVLRLTIIFNARLLILYTFTYSMDTLHIDIYLNIHNNATVEPLSNQDTIGPIKSVLNSEVSLFWGLLSIQM